MSQTVHVNAVHGFPEFAFLRFASGQCLCKGPPETSTPKPSLRARRVNRTSAAVRRHRSYAFYDVSPSPHGDAVVTANTFPISARWDPPTHVCVRSARSGRRGRTE